MTFTTFDLGGHEQGKPQLTEEGLLISVLFPNHLWKVWKDLPKRDAGEWWELAIPNCLQLKSDCGV